MAKRLWCPKCSTDHYHFEHSDEPPTCIDCESRLTEPPTDVKLIWRVKQGIVLSIVAAIFLGPVVWVILNLGNQPLLATRTVEKTYTVTEPYGIIPSLLPVILVWIVLYIIYWGVRGGFPRP